MSEERQPQRTGADRERAAGRRNLLQALPDHGVPGSFIVVILTVLLVLTFTPYLAGVEVGPLGTLPSLDPAAGAVLRYLAPVLWVPLLAPLLPLPPRPRTTFVTLLVLAALELAAFAVGPAVPAPEEPAEPCFRELPLVMGEASDRTHTLEAFVQLVVEVAQDHGGDFRVEASDAARDLLDAPVTLPASGAPSRTTCSRLAAIGNAFNRRAAEREIALYASCNHVFLRLAGEGPPAADEPETNRGEYVRCG